MTNPSDPSQPQAELLELMVKRMKRDLQQEVRDGKLDPDDLEAAINRCQTCDNPDDCRHWMTREDTADAPAPLYCRNRTLLLKLKAQQR